MHTIDICCKWEMMVRKRNISVKLKPKNSYKVIDLNSMTNENTVIALYCMRNKYTCNCSILYEEQIHLLLLYRLKGPEISVFYKRKNHKKNSVTWSVMFCFYMYILVWVENEAENLNDGKGLSTFVENLNRSWTADLKVMYI